jgi:hypothetical protein
MVTWLCKNNSLYFENLNGSSITYFISFYYLFYFWRGNGKDEKAVLRTKGIYWALICVTLDIILSSVFYNTLSIPLLNKSKQTEEFSEGGSHATAIVLFEKRASCLHLQRPLWTWDYSGALLSPPWPKGDTGRWMTLAGLWVELTCWGLVHWDRGLCCSGQLKCLSPKRPSFVRNSSHFLKEMILL